MKKYIAALALSLTLGTSACASAETHIAQGIYTADVLFSDTQSVAIALINSKVLNSTQIEWVKATDHLVAEELKTLNSRLINKDTTISSADIDKIKTDIASFKSGLEVLKGASK